MNTLLKFEASWCHQCKSQDKELEKLQKVAIIHIDVDGDTSESVVGKYKVQSLPTMVLVDKDQNELKKFIGRTSAADLQAAINEFDK